MVNSDKKLIGVYWCAAKNKTIIFCYKKGRWEYFEKLNPWSIKEALKITLQKIEEEIPGTLAKAVQLDDNNRQSQKNRTRRYLADESKPLYIGRPDLEKYSEQVCGYRFITNIPWRDVPHILQIVCESAKIEHGHVSKISL